MAIKQLSVFVPNQAGELVKITDALEKAKTFVDDVTRYAGLTANQEIGR